MRVVVGPVDIASAESWLSYARDVVDDLEFAENDECYASPEVLTVFRDYLDAWDKAAARGGEFLWEADVAVEVVEYHIHAFQKVAEVLADRESRSGVAHAPDESWPFYRALVHGVVTALATEGTSHAEFAEQLSANWPGFEPGS